MQLRQALNLGRFKGAVAAKPLQSALSLPSQGPVAILLWPVPCEEAHVLTLGGLQLGYSARRAVFWRTGPRLDWRDDSYALGFQRRIHLVLHFDAKKSQRDAALHVPQLKKRLYRSRFGS